MLFPYKYVPHQMEKMQEFIDFIFYEVWCKAPIGMVFSPDLLERNSDLREVITYFGFSANAPERGKQFYKDIKGIYELFAGLTSLQIEQLKLWYGANNDIEKVCANDPAIQIAHYADIKVVNLDLSDRLASFFKGLYSHQLLDLAALRSKIGEIDEHYQAFMRVNTMGKCPFCGVADMHGTYHSKREAYDHYLPKALYPFNSINLRNLIPACHHCNSSYKASIDPAYVPKDPAQAGGRRKVFYPFTATDYQITLKIELKTSDIAQLTPADIDLEFGPPELYEQIETWKDVYGIEERYKAKCCSGTDARYWLVRALDESRNYGGSIDEVLASSVRHAKEYLFAESNFLKHAFLDACHRIGIFDPVVSDKSC